MCSWCWGYRRTWDALRRALPGSVTVVNVVGGLAPDSDVPMPAEQREAIAGYWARISEELGAEFNFDFWEKCEPRRSTYPACRAVIAAARHDAEEEMIDAIQRAYYLRAMNPSDNSTLVELAAELGLDRTRFAVDLVSVDVQHELERNFALRREIEVFSFPSLVLQVGGENFPVPLDYHSGDSALGFIRSKT
jgi:putative protein-disulfide isomerase